MVASVTQATEAAIAVVNGHNGIGHEERQTHQLVKQFLKLKSSEFDGSSGPEVTAI